MIRPISWVSSAGYRGVAKPLLFATPPDTVHNHLLQVGAKIGSQPLIRRILQASWAYQNPVLLSQTLHGIEFINPVGLSAGFDKNFELTPLIRAIGFGFMEGGSITAQPCAGNPRPWFHRLPKSQSLVVHAGLANQGADAVVQRLQAQQAIPYLRDFPLNISVGMTNAAHTREQSAAIDDYLYSLQSIQRARAGNMVTLNISCPNTIGGEPFTAPKALDALLKQVDHLKLASPVFIKMPSDLTWPQFAALLDTAASHKIGGVTICNLAKNRQKLTLRDPLPDSIAGGLSGKPTWELSNHFIRQTYKTYGQRFTIIGVGGIFSAQDAYTKIKLGASLTALITGMIFEGPQLIGQINRGLAKFLESDGFKNVSEAVGVET